MAICHKCSSEIADDAAFCPHCGISAPIEILSQEDQTEFENTLFDNTLNMPFPDDIENEVSMSEKAIPDFGERTLEDPRSIDAGIRAKTLETEYFGDEDESNSAENDKAESQIESQVKAITSDLEPSLESEASIRLSVSDAEAGGKTSGLKPLVAGIVLNSRYEIVRKIGGGGMGAVYLALDRNLGGVERAVKEMIQSSLEEE